MTLAVSDPASCPALRATQVVALRISTPEVISEPATDSGGVRVLLAQDALCTALPVFLDRNFPPLTWSSHCRDQSCAIDFPTGSQILGTSWLSNFPGVEPWQCGWESQSAVVRCWRPCSYFRPTAVKLAGTSSASI